MEGAQLIGGEDRVALEGDLADGVLDALEHGDGDFHQAFAGVVVLNVLDLHVDVALAIVIGAQVVEIGAEIIVLEEAGLVDEGEQVLLARFHDLAQFLGRQVIVADEIDLGDVGAVAFADDEGDDRAAVLLVGVDLVADLHLVVALAQVVVLDLVGVGGNLLLAEALADLGLDLLLQARLLDLGFAAENDFLHQGLRLHDDVDLHAVAQRLVLDREVGEEAGRVEIAHVFPDRCGVVGAADGGAHVGKDDRFGHVGRADIDDVDLAHDRAIFTTGGRRDVGRRDDLLLLAGGRQIGCGRGGLVGRGRRIRGRRRTRGASSRHGGGRRGRVVGALRHQRRVQRQENEKDDRKGVSQS